MSQSTITSMLAHELRQKFDVAYRNLRRAENALAQHPSPQSRAILDALAQAERDLHIADAHMRQFDPDATSHKSAETRKAELETCASEFPTGFLIVPVTTIGTLNFSPNHTTTTAQLWNDSTLQSIYSTSVERVNSRVNVHLISQHIRRATTEHVLKGKRKLPRTPQRGHSTTPAQILQNGRTKLVCQLSYGTTLAHLINRFSKLPVNTNLGLTLCGGTGRSFRLSQTGAHLDFQIRTWKFAFPPCGFYNFRTEVKLGENSIDNTGRTFRK